MHDCMQREMAAPAQVQVQVVGEARHADEEAPVAEVLLKQQFSAFDVDKVPTCKCSAARSFQFMNAGPVALLSHFAER